MHVILKSITKLNERLMRNKTFKFELETDDIYLITYLLWFTYVGITSYPGGVVSVSLNKMLYGTFLKFLCKPDLVVKKALGGSWSEKQLYR